MILRPSFITVEEKTLVVSQLALIVTDAPRNPIIQSRTRFVSHAETPLYVTVCTIRVYKLRSVPDEGTYLLGSSSNSLHSLPHFRLHVQADESVNYSARKRHIALQDAMPSGIRQWKCVRCGLNRRDVSRRGNPSLHRKYLYEYRTVWSIRWLPNCSLT
jgi:hypothetical protein